VTSDPTIGSWQGSLEIGDAWACWRGAIGSSRSHAHFAAQAVFSDTGPIKACIAERRLVSARYVLIDPLVTHRIDVAGCRGSVIFIEPRAETGVRLPLNVTARMKALASVDGAQVALAEAQGKYAFWRHQISSQFALNPAGDVDAWCEVVREAIDAGLADPEWSLASAASLKHLSAERFRHRFVDAFGMPFRRYMLWRRLRMDAMVMQSGEGLTVAAHSAGFSDAPHLARTLKSTFGLTSEEIFG
jgi:AraC-like DNA-binding protein